MMQMGDKEWIKNILVDDEDDDMVLDMMTTNEGVEEVESQRRARIAIEMEVLESQERLQTFAALLLQVYLIIGSIRNYLSDRYNIPRNPFHSPEGNDYVRRLLDSDLHDEVHNCRKIYRMDQHVFRSFCALLRSSGGVQDTSSISVETKFAMFVLTVGQDQ
jgi:putative lipase involved disintegration of autophagic bodies